MAQPGNNGLSREGYGVLGILGLAFVSLMIRLRSPYHLPSESVSLVVVSIAAPTVFAVVLLLASRPTTRSGQYSRYATLGILLLGIIVPGSLAFIIVLAPLGWLIAYLLATYVDKPPRAVPAAPSGVASADATVPVSPAALSPAAEAERLRRKKFTLLAIVLSFVVVSVAGRMIYVRRLETTSLMFIGIPALLAILLVVAVRPKSAMGTAMTGITFVLLLSAIVFGEGVICILMAAPIFYIVGAVIAGIMDDSRRTQRTTRMMLLAPLLLMSFEGTSGRTSLPREESVTARRVVAARPGEIADSVAAPLRFRKDLPFYLRMGFPRPVSASGAGLAVGSRRVIGFAGGEGKPGSLTMEVAGVAPQSVTFRALSDTSKVAHWLRWEEAVVSWRQIDERHAEITWTLRYRRNLDPAWYFEPWERYGTGLAAEYLIDNVAAPADKP
ncbi:MAG: hypothetical protein ACHP8B_16855 [Terriglobales bacterium]